MTVNTGGPAFPRQLSIDTRFGGLVEDAQEGMTLRDYFAAKAMQGLADNLVADEATETLEQLASDAYAIADAMLKARGANA